MHATGSRSGSALILALAICAAPALAWTAEPPTCTEGSPLPGQIRTLLDQPRPVWRGLVAPPPAEAAEFISLNVDVEGDGPRELCFTPDGSTLLVVNQDTDTLSFIDAATRQVVGGVTVGDFPQDVAVSPDGTYAVVANVFSNDVSIIDVATRTLVATVPVQGLQAFGVRITPDSARAVVAVINDAVNSQFTVINLGTRAVERVIPTTSQGARGFYGTPEFGISGALYTRFALSPSGADVILPHAAGSKVNIYSVATGALEASIPVAASAGALDVSADGSTVVVAHEGATRRISVIDFPSRTLTASRTVGSDLESAGHIRITPARTHAMCSISNNLIFVDLATGSTTSTIATGIVGDIEISYDGLYAFVPNFNASVITIATQTLAKSITFAACTEAAVSPVSHRAAALNSRFREDAHFYTINGASSLFEGRTLTGAAPEADCPKAVAVSPDGRTLIVANTLSRNASIIDLGTGAVRATVDTGDRGLDAAITPDSSKAVVCNGDQDTVSVIDLNTDTLIANVAIASRPARVVISPDSQYAYILTVAGTDRIHKLRLTETPVVVATQLAGQTGSSLAYAFSEVSGISLSPDGALLGVCDSFNDKLILIDPVTMATVTSATIGDFPIRAIFNADHSRAYIANTFSNDVSVVSISGSTATQIALVTGISSPLGLALDADGSHLYVTSSGTTNPGIYAIDTATNTVAKYLSLGGDKPRDLEFTPNCDVLLAGASAATSGQPDRMYRIRAAGPATAVIDSATLSSSLPDIAYSRARHAAVASMPIPDGVNIVRYEPTSDLTGDGDITLEDYFAFFNAWDVFGPGADMDGDGTVDLTDFFLFFGSFDVGCP
jgi:YVTN family beta-propeller protein